MSDEFYESDASRGFVRGYSFEAIRGFGPLQTAMMGAQRGRVRWGKQHHASYRSLYNHTAPTGSGVLGVLRRTGNHS